MPSTPTTELVAAALTDRGRQRENNEDAFVLRPDRGLLLVSDGIGGHRAGETASTAVATVLPELVESRLESVDPSDAKCTSEALREAVVELSQELRRQSASDPEIAGLGATLALMLFRADAAWLVHMGDSRIYRLRGESLDKLTEDHSLVALLVRRGEMSLREAEQRPDLGRLTRYVGMEGVVYPEVSTQALKDGDRYLVCTDGLTGMLGDDELGSLLQGNADPQRACRALVDAANAAGGLDNVTVIVGDWRCPAR